MGRRGFLIVALITCILSSSFIYGQGPSNFWYFGQKCALNFTSGSAQFVAGSAMHAGEATASISDAAGNLLFYTNGDTIWNATNQVIANGTGLLGSNNAMQGVQIVKWPNTQSLYYVFTLNDNWPVWDLNYSIVDLSLAAGAGSVTIKNVLVQSLVSEHLAFTKHCNGIDVWLATTTYSTNTIKSYLISASGINTVAINSMVGGLFSNSGMQGQMKFSPNGNKLGFVCSSSSYAPNYLGFAFLLDFNGSSGIFSNALLLDTLAGSMGTAFSSDGSKLYATHYTNQTVISQWDLCAPTTSAIVATQFTFAAIHPFLYQLQLAPNGIIIGGPPFEQFLPIINFPNLLGAACGYSSYAISLAGNMSTSGLPNFEGNLIKAPIDSFVVQSSFQNCQTLSFSPGQGYTCQQQLNPGLNLQWDFGEPSSLNFNTSSQTFPTHRYSSAGIFTVTLSYLYPCRTVTLAATVTVSAEPNLLVNNSIGSTLSVCNGQSVQLTASGAQTYSWSTGATSNSILVQSPATITLSGIGINQCVSNKIFFVRGVSCLGLETDATEGDFIIYPNPFTNELIISKGTFSNTIYEIVDLYGSIVKRGTLSNNDKCINTSNLEPGIYTFHFRNFNKKIIKSQN